MISVLITLVVIGLCLYLIETYIPMAQPIRNVIRVVVVLFLVVWLLNTFGIVDIPMGRVR